MMIYGGLDIGTSNIAAAACADDGTLLDSLSRANTAGIAGASFESLQDADAICRIAREAAEELLAKIAQKNLAEKTPHKTKKISAWSISNQMHGMLYVDAQGRACSPLFTWQDARGAQKNKEGLTVTEWAERAAGYRVPAGYGLITHLYNLQHGLVPREARRVVDIGTYVACVLCGLNAASDAVAMHPSNAHAFGFFSFDGQGGFDREAMARAGIDPAFVPRAEEIAAPLGHAFDGAPLYQPLGDNQAGFLGALGDARDVSVLINMGTSGQVSFTDNLPFPGDALAALEKRPFIRGGMLSAGSVLCGGKSIGLWVDLICGAVAEASNNQTDCALFANETAREDFMPRLKNALYDALQNVNGPTDARAAAASSNEIQCTPHFQGTRSDAAARAVFSNIGAGNFTFLDMGYAIMHGVSRELHELWLRADERTRAAKTSLHLTGGAFRLAPLRAVVEQVFADVPNCVMQDSREDAAAGAAAWAALNYASNSGGL